MARSRTSTTTRTRRIYLYRSCRCPWAKGRCPLRCHFVASIIQPSYPDIQVKETKPLLTSKISPIHTRRIHSSHQPILRIRRHSRQKPQLWWIARWVRQIAIIERRENARGSKISSSPTTRREKETLHASSRMEPPSSTSTNTSLADPLPPSLHDTTARCCQTPAGPNRAGRSERGAPRSGRRECEVLSRESGVGTRERRRRTGCSGWSRRRRRDRGRESFPKPWD